MQAYAQKPRAGRRKLRQHLRNGAAEAADSIVLFDRNYQIEPARRSRDRLAVDRLHGRKCPYSRVYAVLRKYRLGVAHLVEDRAGRKYRHALAAVYGKSLAYLKVIYAVVYPPLAAAPEARVGVAHGKMSPREVEDVMIEFATKKIDVLIATTIVESGIDNATANTLIIEDSQRLGLAQLYQLKGRVGRSATQAYAYFMFPGELPLTEEATARLTALSEFQDLGSGMRIAMRDLEIRGAGSLMGAEQHGNLSSVGFDLFTQMLGQAVAEARGDDDAGVEAASVGINLPADYFLSEEYMPAVDQRVLVYRKLAAAEDLESIDEVQEETEAAHGELPLAGLNLFNRARIRIRGERLGLESVTLSGGRITFLGVDVPKKVAFELKTRYGAVNFPKSRKLSVPYKAGAGAGSGLGRGLDANDGTGPVAAALMLLQQLGASDDD